MKVLGRVVDVPVCEQHSYQRKVMELKSESDVKTSMVHGEPEEQWHEVFMARSNNYPIERLSVECSVKELLEVESSSGGLHPEGVTTTGVKRVWKKTGEGGHPS